MMIIRR